ncbi:MAG: MBL fold metallo-hydrolase [Oscillospiraceae bacterium]|nr:MBL fold metallo-hydrolase [Oscillospiraceae bacterium]
MEKIELKLIKVTDRLYYLPHYEKNDWCTIGLIIGDKHTMMLDSGASERHVKMFMQQLEENGLPKPDLCALTHWHWDHTYGLAHLENVTSFATKQTNELLKKMQDWQWSDEDMKKRIETGEDLAFSYPHINDEYPDKSLIKVETATVEYAEKLTIDLGGVTVKLKMVENSHSYDCAIIYIPEEKCIFLGDIHYEDLLPEKPVYYKDSHNKLITALRKFDFDKVLSGHQMLMDNVQLFSQLAGVETV